MAGTIYMTRKSNTLLRHLCIRSQAKHLKSAAVGEYGPVPTHELVKTPRLLNQIDSGPQHEVVGVGKDDLRTCIAYFLRMQGLDRRLGADGHKHRCLDISTSSVNRTSPGHGAVIFSEK